MLCMAAYTRFHRSGTLLVANGNSQCTRLTKATVNSRTFYLDSLLMSPQCSVLWNIGY